MLDSPALPPNCTLRPVSPSDYPQVKQLLSALEQELSPRRSPLWFSILGLLLCVLLIGLPVIYGWWVPEARRVVLPWLSLVALLLGGTLLGLWWTIQQEWSCYWVVDYQETHSEEQSPALIACAKLQTHGSYSLLYDVYVVPAWRCQGIGSCIVQTLGQQAMKPLYLACFPARLPFYRRLGFVPVTVSKLSPMVRYDLGLVSRPGIVALMLAR